MSSQIAGQAESIYISKSGYMETLVANETSEDVWFDNFRIEVQTPIVVQEPLGISLNYTAGS